MLQKDRHPNLDLFIANFWFWPIKDDQASMEHPFFSLAKTPDHTERRYEHNGNVLQIIPGGRGMPTIWDKDVLIYCCSQLVEGMKQGATPHPVIRFHVYDFLVSTNRSSGQKGYQLLEKTLDRLSGVRIKTNVKTGGQEEISNFGLLDWWHMVVNEPYATVQIKLSDWLYRAITNLEVLTLTRTYFLLTGSMERRVYELCRKHCGNQETWSIHLPLLYKKSGSIAPLRRFRYEMKQLAQINTLPDYSLTFDPQTDKLTVYPKTHKGGLRQLKDTLGI
jgi:plasmid replication initiation protein